MPASKRSPALESEICARLSTGEPLAQICRDDHMPDPSTVRDWMAADAELSRAIARAREAGEDAISVQCLTIADEEPPTTPQGSKDSAHVAWQKVRIETRLKLLAKWNPRKWADRVQADHTSSDGSMTPKATIDAGALSTATLTELLNARRTPAD